MHEHLQHADRESKTLLPTHALEHFPRDLRCRKVGDAHVEVELFGERTENLAAAELIFPALENGGQTYARYELVDEHHRSGEVFLVYRKFHVSRRKLETSGLVLPGRG